MTQARLKAILDRIAGVTLLTLLSPVLAVIGAVIAVIDGLPVIFRQQRVGKDGNLFEIVKFRSMIPDAVSVGRSLGIVDGDDPFAIVRDDPRLTRTGGWLRRTSLDELPQLFNVIRGEMSLVGPRPDIPSQVENYTTADRRRLLVKPGITGYAQVNGRDMISWPERISQDLWYIDNWSLWLDLKVIAKTVLVLRRDEPDPIADQANASRRSATGHAGSRIDPDGPDGR